MIQHQENIRTLLEITDTNIRWCKDTQWRTAFYTFSLHAAAYVALGSNAAIVPSNALIAFAFFFFAIVDGFAIAVLIDLHFSIAKYRYREWCIARRLHLDMHFTGMSQLSSAGRSPFLYPLSAAYLCATIGLGILVASTRSDFFYFTLVSPLASLLFGLFWYRRRSGEYQNNLVVYGQRILQYPEILKKDGPDISNFEQVKDKLQES